MFAQQGGVAAFDPVIFASIGAVLLVTCLATLLPPRVARCGSRRHSSPELVVVILDSE